MVDEAGAYAALELSPDAAWNEVERAYKRLIGVNHPDRAGGNAGRAAEITQAYRELRRARDRKEELRLAGDLPELKSGRYRWLWAAPGFLLLGGVLIVANSGRSHESSRPPSEASLEPAFKPGDLMGGPLALSPIANSVNEARRLASTRDEMALASVSRDCHRQLSAKPSIDQFDRCAAFDDAVVQLQDRDPLHDRGPFSEIAVTSRQVSAAETLSGDSLAIDGRLDRIRLQVELALAPATAAN